MPQGRLVEVDGRRSVVGRYSQGVDLVVCRSTGVEDSSYLHSSLLC